jgi:putative ABC transport system permease protein
MIKVAIKGLLGRKLRAVLTAFAIVLGVAMVSGTYVLTDTIKKGFDTIFTVSYKNADAAITGKTVFGNSNNTTAPSIPASVLTRVKALPGVVDAVGGVEYDETHLVGRKGKSISTGGAPNLGFSVNTRDQLFNPLKLVGGQWPAAPNQIAIDKQTADKNHYKVGDTIGVSVHGPTTPFRITGIAELGGVASIGGATLAIFDLPTAQALFHKQGQLDEIRVSKSPELSSAKLLSEIRAILPPTAQVRTGAAQAKQDASDTTSFLSVLQKFLLAFGFIALFVGSFVIANTLSITITQRTRELATLRTIGASRRQVLASVLAEALAVGVLASIVGLGLGVALAKGLDALFVSFGIDLPKAGTVFETRTVIVSLAVGILVTLAASLRPAIRATRVPPIAAVREGSVLPVSRLARFGPLAALAVGGTGTAALVLGAFGHGIAGTDRLILVGVGVLMLFVGVAIIAPRIVKPIARGVGPIATWTVVALGVVVYPISLLWWALRTGVAKLFRRDRIELPSVRPDKVANRLAAGNALRNPARTASTAAALMIGLALVTFVAVLAAGLKSTFESAVKKQFNADYALTSQNGFTPTDISSAVALKKLPQVTTVAGVRAGRGKAFGGQFDVTAVDPGISKVLKVPWKDGSQATLETLGSSGAVVSDTYAKKHNLTVGSPLHVLTPYNKTLDLRVAGIFKVPKGGSPFGSVTTSAKTFDAVYPNPQNVFTLVNINGGVTPANTQLLNKTLATFPDAKIQTEKQFEHSQEQGINVLLNLLFVLLGLSIVISLFGIVNTLVLTVFERTRELGMLRAVGMTRRQVKRMIRHESVMTALIGAALGIPLGIVLALLIGKAINFAAFAVPYTTLVVFVIAAVIAGIVAAIFPARRASRLNVLAALQYE